MQNRKGRGKSSPVQRMISTQGADLLVTVCLERSRRSVRLVRGLHKKVQRDHQSRRAATHSMPTDVQELLRAPPTLHRV
jgi:hypothetical protein